nr:40S ribosomal protein S21-like [Tanacetum cinerariifolium]
MDLYIPRKFYATNRLIMSKDHASVHISVGCLDKSDRYIGRFSTFALCGFVRAQDLNMLKNYLWISILASAR